MRREPHWPTTRSMLLGQLSDPQDATAWRQFVDLYLPFIYQYALNRGLQDADAQNVAQDVLAKVFSSIQSFEYDPLRGRFRNWLGLITHQRLLRHIKKESAVIRGMGDGIGDALCNELPQEIEGEWLEELNFHIYRSACAKVRPEFDARTWTAFEQVWEAGRQPRDVAVEMGQQPAWVYQAKFKVLQRIQEEVKRLSEDDILASRSR